MQQKKYIVRNVSFVQCTAEETADSTHIYEAICNYKTDRPAIILPHLKDSGNAFQILNDRLCTDIPKRDFITGITVKDLAVEEMDQEKLCEKYMIMYR
jgi:hypothetical protein